MPLERVRFIIDRSRPIVDQVLVQIASLLVAGALRTTEQLPTHPEAAKVFGVSGNTVVSIYRILAQHGIIAGSSGAGTYFTEHAQQAACRYLVSVNAAALVRNARALGLSEEEIVGVFLAVSTRGQSSEGETLPSD